MIVFVRMSQRLCASPTAQVAAYTIYGTWPSDTPVLQYVVQRFDSNGSGAKNKKLGGGHELSNLKKKGGQRGFRILQRTADNEKRSIVYFFDSLKYIGNIDVFYWEP